MKKLIITIFVTIFISSTLYLILDSDEQNLGDNYFYLPEYEAIDFGFPNGSVIYKSEQKYIFTNVKIQGDILLVNSDENFIVAIQKIKNINKQYFIIEKKTDLIHGPHNKKDYLQKRAELGIPEGLKFKEE